MATLVREGGFPVFFLLAFGLLAMVFAVRFATAPHAARLADLPGAVGSHLADGH